MPAIAPDFTPPPPRGYLSETHLWARRINPSNRAQIENFARNIQNFTLKHMLNVSFIVTCVKIKTVRGDAMDGQTAPSRHCSCPLAQRDGVQSIPTFVAFSRGSEVARAVGDIGPPACARGLVGVRGVARALRGDYLVERGNLVAGQPVGKHGEELFCLRRGRQRIV